ncbi:hypothetical protein ACEWY4_001942 [Coilia grayii]|uniref:Caspase family p20 domain-containing protein n=1 Tax=Coilia grayii TaxID=363190 RepID=A0ABD1KUC9_9TELE
MNVRRESNEGHTVIFPVFRIFCSGQTRYGGDRGQNVMSAVGLVTNDQEDYYPMNSRPRGLCVIINNFRFNNSEYKDREGTEKDADYLQRVFGQLHFVVEERRDLSWVQGSVVGVDGKAMSITDIYRPFTHCHSLADKPKLFFIQACQYLSSGFAEHRHKQFEEDADTPLSIKADALCKQLELGCPKKEDLLTILIRVNKEVSKRYYGRYMQVPQPRYTLTKKLVLTVD